MTIVLLLLCVQGAIGAFDTVYYHEYKAQLPSRRAARSELWLHGARSMLYMVIFGTLPWMAWGGMLSWLLAAIIVTEIVITLADFVVEDTVRRDLGGVYAVERVTHAIMGIIYGAMLAYLFPTMWGWASLQTGFVVAPADAPANLRYLVSLMAIGVGASGVRDLLAAWRGWCWPYEARPSA